MKSTQALIFNIQKFSIHDGPGIRTVVFFKGCPLSCKWCSNPESRSGKIEMLMPLKKGGKPTVCGEYMGIERIMDEIMQDTDFYKESCGGVTLSGGEVLVQADFARSLLQCCKKENLHTAVETTGYTPLNTLKKIIPFTDLFLFDVKHYDRQKHFEGTGVYNDIILDNLRFVLNAEKKVLVRIPVIPGYNNGLQDAEAFAVLLKKIGTVDVQLLPFHQFGQNKYRQLGVPYTCETYAPLHAEDLDSFVAVFKTFSLNAFV